MKYLALTVCALLVGCTAGIDSEQADDLDDEDVATAEDPILDQGLVGFYSTPSTGNKILAVWSGATPYYCWVVDSGHFEAIRTQNNWSTYVASTSLTNIADSRPGSSSTSCPWPNGMLIRNSAVYLIQGSSRTLKGTACHILNNEQVAHHGGWTLVWDPKLAPDRVKFEYGVTNLGPYPANVPACVW
jgi:hypothetical protein